MLRRPSPPSAPPSQRWFVLDVMLPGISGIGVARELFARRPEPARVGLEHGRPTKRTLRTPCKRASLGTACKSQSAAEVMDAIRTVARGETYLAPQVSGFVVSDYRRLRKWRGRGSLALATLTAREREIFELCIQGSHPRRSPGSSPSARAPSRRTAGASCAS